MATTSEIIDPTTGELPEFCSAEIYHAHHAVSNSALKVFSESRELYRARYIDRTIVQKPTPAMKLGTMVHCAVLEPLEFADRFLIAPELAPDGKKWLRRKGSDHERWWMEYEESTSGKQFVEPGEREKASAIAAAINANPHAAQFFRDGALIEHCIEWTDGETELPCKSRRDLVLHSTGIIADLKTCADASPEGFSRAAENFGYYRQADFYLEGHYRKYDEQAEFVFLCVQTEPPYEVGVHQLSPEWIKAGREENRKYLRQLAECADSGNWQNPWSAKINVLERPNFGKFKNQYEVQ